MLKAVLPKAGSSVAKFTPEHLPELGCLLTIPFCLFFLRAQPGISQTPLQLGLTVDQVLAKGMQPGPRHFPCNLPSVLLSLFTGPMSRVQQKTLS